jgi:hypothetical protein
MPNQTITEHDPKIESPEAVVRHLLLAAGEKLPPSSRDTILEQGSLAIPALLQIFEEEKLRLSDAPGEGWAPIHAAELLGALKATEAAAPMLRVLSRTDPLTILHNQILVVIKKLGDVVVEPALKAYAETNDSEHQSSLCAVLAGAGVHDDRILTILRRQLQEELVIGASCLAEYGDPRALPDLLRALDECRVDDSDNLFANDAVLELKAAILELGGTLTTAQASKIERATRLPAGIRALREAAHALPQKKIGRNDPCWCGSGKKFKKCHGA